MKKIAFYTSILIALVVGMKVWLHNFQAKPLSGERPPPTFPMGVAVVTSTPQEIALKPAGMDDRTWLALRGMYQGLKQENQPVEFSVHILDQDGQAVAGTVLTATLSHVDDALTLEKFLKTKTSEQWVYDSLSLVSDQKGWIHFKGRSGKSVSFDSLSKEGYSVHFPQGQTELCFNPGYRGSPSGKTVRDPSDFKTTKTLYLWKNGGTEKLVKLDCIVPVEAFGTNWYAANLLTGVVNNLQDADFLFWFETIKDSNGNPARQFRYQIQNGGLIFDTGLYPYQAPETGYTSEWDWYYEPSGKNANDDPMALLKKNFYVKLRSGKIYGAITWNWNSEGGVSITGHLNPTGTRNLEPDPAKLITDPAEIRRLDEATRVK